MRERRVRERERKRERGERQIAEKSDKQNDCQILSPYDEKSS